MPGFQPFFTTSPKFFGQAGDVPKIKILPKNTKPMHVYYDFFHSFCLSQYEYMSRTYKLETEQCNISVPENKRISRESSWYLWSLNRARVPQNHFMSPHWGRVLLKNRALTLQNRPGFFGALCMISHVVSVSASLNVCRARLSTAAYRRFRRHPRRLPVFKEFYLFPFRWCQVPAQ